MAKVIYDIFILFMSGKVYRYAVGYIRLINITLAVHSVQLYMFLFMLDVWIVY